MYSLEAICLNKSTLNNLDSMLYNAFSKIFKTYDRDVYLNPCIFRIAYQSNLYIIKRDYPSYSDSPNMIIC